MNQPVEKRAQAHQSIDAEGVVNALQAGTLGAALSGVVAVVAAANAFPIAVVAGLPVLVGIGAAAAGYKIRAKDK